MSEKDSLSRMAAIPEITNNRAMSPNAWPSEDLEITLPLSEMSILHNTPPRPKTPELPPASLSPLPLRYPDTLHTLVEIRDTELKGLGVFALRDIQPGTILLSEAPLVTLIDTGSRADPLDFAVNALSPEKKASFLSLHSFSRNRNESLSRSIVYSNGYAIMNDLGTGVFETASRINHSCVPNSQYLWKESIGRMLFWNDVKLMEGEEVTVDYGHKPKYLAKIYGFVCACGGCTDYGSDEMGSSGSEGGGTDEIRGIDGVVHKSLKDQQTGKEEK